ncbi:zinc-binding dehydrogenase [Algoriphagus aestuarii]|nr:zinc-binding dehydrogenase [Algoriphagus aestuarii]
MKAITLDSASPSKLYLNEVQEGKCKNGEVKISIRAAALNHRDEWCRKGLYPNIQDGITLGSDGAGVVEEVGDGVDLGWLGKQVIINPAIHWGSDQKAQGKDFEILGMPRNGTLAEKVIVPADRIVLKPEHLSFETAAALPLAGVTAYRALFYHGLVKSGEKVLVTGFGGGVAQFAFQFALATGAKVFVSSSSEAKRSTALKLGAEAAFDYKEKEWAEEALQSSGGIDLIIDSAAGNTFNNLLHVLNPGGRLIFYGATRGNINELNARKIFWNQLKIQGTTMGSDQDFEEMIQFVSQHEINPILDQVFPFEKFESAFDRMRDGKQLGKIVLVP